MAGTRVAFDGREAPLSALEAPLPIDDLIPGAGPWEVEIGFGKGRYLLRRAAESPAQRFLGIEVAARYFRLVRQRAVKRDVGNLLLVRGEALYLLSALLPVGFASAVHVYFPDPWPKARHQNRRLFDRETVDLVLGLLGPGGVLFFATDFLDYAEVVAEILDSHPGVSRRSLSAPWQGEARTNYEAKYIREGRPIARFEVTRRVEERGEPLHPEASSGIRAAVSSRAQEPAEAVGSR
jgi:tRNA (guanine-N7-)-methyltransferase